MSALAVTRMLLGCAAARPPRLLSPLRMSRAALHTTRMQYDDDTNYGMPFEARPPSEKQVQFAQRLAQQLAKPLPQEALHDSSATSAFIDECLTQAPPTERQAQYAQAIAEGAGIALPDFVLSNAKATSEYIDANQHLLDGKPRTYGSPGGGEGGMMSSGGGAPSDKQILFATRLARERNLGISAEALADKRAISVFIDQCLEKQREASAPAPTYGGGAAAAASGMAGMAGAAAAATAGDADTADIADTADTASGGAASDTASDTNTAMDELDRLFDDPMDEENGEDAPEGGAGEGPSYLREKDVPF